MSEYILYASYASYYSAKSRAYLRKKSIPFQERVPSDPLFREYVRKTSGTAKIPQLLTAEKEVIQDTVDILDFLEARHPEIPAFPATPRQRIFTHLMELMASEGLLILSWLHRWLPAENAYFVKMDFGRSFAPRGNDEELMKYGQIIADKMTTAGVLPEATPEMLALIDEQCLGVLEKLEKHFQYHPYFLGGQPCAADYAIMGALHAHMGRDPVPLQFMQTHAPRVFRWVEHMQVPEIRSPEFFDRDEAFFPDDLVPDTALDVLQYIGETFGERLLLSSIAFSQYADKQKLASGHPINPGFHEPVLNVKDVDYKGRQLDVVAQVHIAWLAQRAQKHFHALKAEDQKEVLSMLGEGINSDIVTIPVNAEIIRNNYRLEIK